MPDPLKFGPYVSTALPSSTLQTIRRLRQIFGTVALCATASLSLASIAGAQSSPDQSIGVVPGTRVRVSAPTLVAPLVANFLHVKGDTAVFMEDAAARGIWSIRIAEITSLERSGGEQRMNADYMMRGGLIGGGVGAVGGILFAASAKPSDASKKYNRLTTGLVGAGAGALVGVLVGSRFSKEGWVPVPLRRMSVVPSRDGVTLGTRFVF